MKSGCEDHACGNVILARAASSWPVNTAPQLSGSSFDAYPGPVRIGIRLPQEGDGYSPLLATGTASEVDFLNVARLGRNRFRFNFVQWSGSESVSTDFAMDEDADHVLEVSLGSLFPPMNSAIFGERPEWLLLRHRLFVAIDGQVVFDQN